MKRFLAISLILLLALAGAGASYYFGWWIPNGATAQLYPIRGIDVSNHQGEIDWKRVATDHVDFAYLKATEGGDFRDRSFAKNWSASAKAGIARGAYHFFTFTPGRKQAEIFIATVPVDPKALPPAVDLEYWGTSGSRPSVAEYQKQLTIFLDLVRKAYGKEPILYADASYSAKYLEGYPVKRLWFTDVFWKPDCPWLVWQYSDKGRLSGIEGNVDLDAFNGDREDFEKFRRE